jgi:hypothetical protein
MAAWAIIVADGTLGYWQFLQGEKTDLKIGNYIIMEEKTTKPGRTICGKKKRTTITERSEFCNNTLREGNTIELGVLWYLIARLFPRRKKSVSFQISNFILFACQSMPPKTCYIAQQKQPKAKPIKNTVHCIV